MSVIFHEYLFSAYHAPVTEEREVARRGRAPALKKQHSRSPHCGAKGSAVSWERCNGSSVPSRAQWVKAPVFAAAVALVSSAALI